MRSVAKAEWGAKHTCLSCGAKFYDMGRSPIVCPSCDAPFTVAAPGRTRRARKADVKEAVAAPVVAKAADDADLIDDVDDLIEDDDDDDDIVVALTDDDDEDDDDVLAEADLRKSKISDE